MRREGKRNEGNWDKRRDERLEGRDVRKEGRKEGKERGREREGESNTFVWVITMVKTE